MQVNLLPVKKLSIIENKLFQVLSILLILILGTGIFYMITGKQLQQTEDLMTAFEYRLNEYSKAVPGIEELENKIELLHEEVELIHKLEDNYPWPDMLIELAYETPEKIQLTEMSFYDNQIILKGISQDYESISSFLEGLENSSKFKKLNLDTSRLKREEEFLTFYLESLPGKEPK